MVVTALCHKVDYCPVVELMEVFQTEPDFEAAQQVEPCRVWAIRQSPFGFGTEFPFVCPR